jgi:hypothetical protein
MWRKHKVISEIKLDGAALITSPPEKKSEEWKV